MKKGIQATVAVAAAAAMVAVVLVVRGSDEGESESDSSALTYRGVTYDTGTLNAPGELSRARWSTELMEGEVEAIADQLHANSVAVFGSDVERLVETARAALERNLHVWIQPRLYDRPQREILAHLAQTAREAERLRQEHEKVSLNVGVESSLFTPGIVSGASWWDRIEKLSSGRVDSSALQRRLNAFLARAARVARRHFRGEITYAAGPWEAMGIPWRLFDVVGLDYYEFHPNRAGHARQLGRFRRFGRPIVITEFGTNAFEGAQKLEGGGWAIVDYTKQPPEIPATYVRNERVQATYLVEMLDVFESQRLYGAYVYTFISPDSPHSPNPRFDVDMASYGLAKVIRESPWQPASPYRWEPKQAFHALADHFGAGE